jgi:hypothetical protein
MNDFFADGVYLGSTPTPVGGGKDLGELGGSGVSAPGGFVAEASTPILPSEGTVATYWSRATGIVFPYTIGDSVAIGRITAAYGAKFSVEGNIYANGYLLSNTVRITKDGDDNLVFTDLVSGSKTLAEILAAAGGDVLVQGTPELGQLAVWFDGTHIQGVPTSMLAIAESQVVDLIYDLGQKASLVHNLVDNTNHPVTGLTTGHFLKALTAGTYGFEAHGLTKTDIGLPNVTNDAQVKKIASSTNLAIARWDGATGALLKNSTSTLADDGSINIPTGAYYKKNGFPIITGEVLPFHVQAFATPTITLDGTTNKDFIIGTITDDTEISITGLINGDAGQIELIVDGTGGYAITLGAAFTKQLGTTIIDNTANADNFISFRKVGTDVLYTISQVV